MSHHNPNRLALAVVDRSRAPRYAGYPSEVAVGCTLYHVAADEPTELRCSWGGPANRVGGNTPADGEWVPVVAAVEQSVGEALHASAPAEGEELPSWVEDAVAAWHDAQTAAAGQAKL